MSLRILPESKIDVIESGSSEETVGVHAEDELELAPDEGVHVDNVEEDAPPEEVDVPTGRITRALV